MEIQQFAVQPSRLLLDPNNYRFFNLTQYRRVPNRSRYGEPGVQENTLRLIQNEEAFDLNSLKDSIRTNGYVPLEQIVVEVFDGDGDDKRYLIIEGNRRVAAVVTLLSENEAGTVDIPDEHLESLTRLPVIELIGTEAERANYRQTLMAIRHVAGIKEWGPYQQALLIAELYENEDRQFGSVAQRIGITSREIARRYRAIKALQQMEGDDEFGEHATPKLYSFFHEAVSQPRVRTWLGFSDTTFQAENDDARETFYELLSPREVDGTVYPPKLQNAYREVRQLKEIVDKEVPLQILRDSERSFEDAVRAAQQETVQDTSGALEHSLATALNALRSPGIHSWLNPSDRSVSIWHELVALVDGIRNTIGSDGGSGSLGTS